MPLSDTSIRSAKAKEKPYKLADEKGLFLLVNTSGAKYWRLKYRINGKEKLLAIGVYPDVTLKDARARRDDARKLLANGQDPGEVKKAQRASRLDRASNSFEVIARRWHSKGGAKWSESYTKKVMQMLERDLFPWLGGKPIADLEAPDFLAVARRLEERSLVDAAHRAMQLCGQIMRFAVAEGLVSRDPVSDLRGALESVKTEHMASVTDPVRVGEILRMFDGFKGSYQVMQALKLAPLVFTRPGELRQAKWKDMDLDAALWSIPAEVMKMREPHLVPLSTQAVAILRDMEPFSSHLEHVFPGGRDPKRPMSDAAINAAMRRLGIDTQVELTGHGFRAMARTILHEQLNYPPEVIEVQLAHKAPGPLGAAYARAKFIEQRKGMMQAWADYLGRLKTGAEIVPLRIEAA